MMTTVIRASLRRLRATWNSPRLHAALAYPWLRRRRPGEPRSILVFQTNHIGDFVLGTPLLVALREAYPTALLHLAVVPGLANLASHCPVIDGVVVLPDGLEYWGPAPQANPRRLARLAWVATRTLRRIAADVAIVPRRDIDAHGAAVLALFSGAPRRVGFAATATSSRMLNNAGFDSYFTDVVSPPEASHEVTAVRSLATALGIAPAAWQPIAWHSAGDAMVVDGLLAEANLQHRRLVVFAPGGTSAFRRWPARLFAEVGRAVVAAADSPCVVIVGSTADREAGEEIRASLPDGTCHDFAGRLRLGQTVALLHRACLFVGNDSGPLHLAAAAGVPCVEISSFPGDGDPMHHNSPVRFGPWAVPRRILQPATARPPCHGACTSGDAHCILEIVPSMVIEAVRDLLATTSANIALG